MGENRGNTLTFKKMLGWSDNISLSIRYQFRGVYCNLREYRFYKDSRNPFLWPTLFSLFGLVNIQPYARNDLSNDQHSRLWRFISEVTNEKATKDKHTFNEKENFVIDGNGYLRMLDYGSTESQEIIREFGHRLYTESRQLFS
jgi:hypothetical protein